MMTLEWLIASLSRYEDRRAALIEEDGEYKYKIVYKSKIFLFETDYTCTVEEGFLRRKVFDFIDSLKLPLAEKVCEIIRWGLVPPETFSVKSGKCAIIEARHYTDREECLVIAEFDSVKEAAKYLENHEAMWSKDEKDAPDYYIVGA